jgi:hypothetical protein
MRVLRAFITSPPYRSPGAGPTGQRTSPEPRVAQDFVLRTEARSRAGDPWEISPQTLAEPYVTVSRHTAPTGRRRVKRQQDRVGEECGLSLASIVQPVPGPGEHARSRFEVLHGQSHEVFVDVACKRVQLGVGEGLTGLTEPWWRGLRWRAARPCSAGGYEAQITTRDRVDRGWLAQQRLLSPTQAMLDRLVHQAPALRVFQSGHGTSGRW